jgi:hypothetical protein
MSEAIDWKFNEDTMLAFERGACCFWYDLTIGGYIKPKEFLIDPDQIEKLQNASEIVQSFEKAFYDYDVSKQCKSDSSEESLDENSLVAGHYNLVSPVTYEFDHQKDIITRNLQPVISTVPVKMKFKAQLIKKL